MNLRHPLQAKNMIFLRFAIDGITHLVKLKENLSVQRRETLIIRGGDKMAKKKKMAKKATKKKATKKAARKKK